MKIEEQIKKYLEWCESVADMTPYTVQSKGWILRKNISQLDIECISELTPEKFIQWKNRMRSGHFGSIYAINTCNTRIKALRVFVRWIEEMGYAEINIKNPMMRPVRDSETIIDYTFYKQRQIAEVIKRADRVSKIMISLFFESGLRISEFRNIKVSDIDFKNARILIFGKGRKYGYVYFSFKTGLAIREYIQKMNLDESDYLWKSPRSEQPYSTKTIRSRLKRCFENCGFYGFRPHQLRHSFATDMIERGATIEEVRILLRHKNITTTEIYIHNLQNKAGDFYKRIRNEELYFI